MQSGPPICRLLARARRTSGSGCSGWPTPNAGPQNDGDLTWPERRKVCKDRHDNGNGFGLTLGMAAQLAGWPMPMAGSPAMEDCNEAGNTDSSRKTVALAAGWMTPQAMDSTAITHTHDQGNPDKPRPTLYGQALISGPPANGSPAPTARRGALNPAFSLWLMGFPSDWLTVAPEACRARKRCEASETPSSRKLPRCSSGRSSRRKKN
jgi:hypothetical protein